MVSLKSTILSVLKAILGSISGACADTWASEIGSVLFYSQVRRKAKEEDFKLRQERLPKCRLIVWPMKKVPRGTNGGVSMGGLLASLLGALVIATTSLITLYINSGIGFSDSNDFKLVKVFILSNATTGMIHRMNGS